MFITIQPKSFLLQTWKTRTNHLTATSDPPAPEGLIPNVTSNATVLLALFANKGISSAQLAALVGAHSTSRQFSTSPLARLGEPQDDTPGIWDVDFYADTANPPEGVFVFQSDIALMNDPTSGPTFKGFVGKQGAWDGAFKAALVCRLLRLLCLLTRSITDG